jgi:hypothetical protein
MAKLCVGNPKIDPRTVEINVTTTLNPTLLTARTPLTGSAPLVTNNTPLIKLSSGKELSVVEAKAILHNYIVEAINANNVKNRKNLPATSLPGRTHDFAIGISTKNNQKYVGDRYFSAHTDDQGNVLFSARDENTGQWNEVKQEDEIERCLNSSGLLNQILEFKEANKALAVSATNQGLYKKTKLSSAEIEQLKLLSQFIREEGAAKGLDKATSGSHQSMSLGQNNASFIIGKSSKNDNLYLSNKLISVRFNGDKLEFKKTGIHDQANLTPQDALQYDLIKQVTNYQAEKNKKSLEKSSATDFFEDVVNFFSFN